jgi:hypothetical protein
MTIPAVNAVIAHMMLVAELDGLLARHVLARHIGRTGDSEHRDQRQSSQKNSGEHTEPGDEVRTAMKNLGHVRLR